MQNPRKPNMPTGPSTSSGQRSGPMHYGAGHREVHEILAGREYRESGSLLREWITTRRTLEPDPRYFGPVVPPWPVRVYRRLSRWVCQSAAIAPLLALAFGGVWAAWTLGGAVAGIVAFLAVCLFVGWHM